MSSSSVTLEQGKDTTFLLFDALNVGQVKKMVLNWNYVNSLSSPSTLCGLFCRRNLDVASVQVSQLNAYPES